MFPVELAKSFLIPECIERGSFDMTAKQKIKQFSNAVCEKVFDVEGDLKTGVTIVAVIVLALLIGVAGGIENGTIFGK